MIQAGENLESFRTEEMERLKDKEAQQRIENILDMITNRLKDQNFNTGNLTNFENNTLIYVSATKQIHTEYGRTHTTVSFLSDDLNFERELFHFRSNF